MKSIGQFWKKMSAYARAVLFLALAFLLVGMGTLGSFQSTGKAYELKKGAAIVYKLTKTEEQKSLKAVYCNFGTPYCGTEEFASVRLRYASQTGTTYSSLGTAKLAHVNCNEEGAQKDALFQWSQLFDLSKRTLNLSSYIYFEISTVTCNLLINEIVFVADDGTVIAAEIDKDRSKEVSVSLAANTLDKQYLPKISQSSFFRYGEREVYAKMTLAEMWQGEQYGENNTYAIDKVNGGLGYSFLALSTLVFGNSPFGLRFFPMLASFGVLCVGYLLVKRLFASDRAGFLFVLLYTTCGASFSLGRLGTPLMLGIFFVILSYYAVHRFYAQGMKGARLRDGSPLLVAGLSSAAAIAVNSVLCVPVVATVGLFIAGMVRQRKAKAYYLAKTKETEKSAIQTQFSYKNRIAITLFTASLLMGGFLLCLLFLLPVYYPYVKVFDRASAPTLTLFALLGKSLAGGFVGSNPVLNGQSQWHYLYRLFTGGGEKYAVTLATFGGIGFLCSVAGALFAIVRLIVLVARKERGKEARRRVRTLALPLIAVAVCILPVIFVADKLTMLALMHISGMLLAVAGFESVKEGRVKKVLFIVGICLLSVQLALLVPFVFSIPLPAAWQTALFF